MKIKNIFGEEIDYRECIGLVLDALYDDFNLKPEPKMKASKMATWHLALEDLSDNAIAKGYKKSVSEQLKFIPSSGVFKSYCIQPPKLEFYKPPPEIEHTPEEKEKLKKSRASFFERFKND